MIKRCNKCGALVKVFKDCNCNDCGIKCCGEELQIVKPNSVDAAIEKHVPEYEVIGDEIKVKVNHVMDDDHYIEWISYVCEKNEQIVYFKPGEEATAIFKCVKGSTLYSYCNKHSLWSKVVD